MASADTQKKTQYKNYAYWMIITGGILYLAGSFLGGEVFTFLGVIIGGAGLVVLFTNW